MFFGSFLYDRGGFYLRVRHPLAATALILPLVFLMPKSVLSIREGTAIEPLTT